MKEEILKKWHELINKSFQEGDFYKINENLLIARIRPWGKEEQDLFFVVAHVAHFDSFTIYGAGKDMSFALFEAIANFANGKNVCLEDIYECSLKELLDKDTKFY